MGDQDVYYFKIDFSDKLSNHYLTDEFEKIEYKEDDEKIEDEKTMVIKISILSIIPDISDTPSIKDPKTSAELVAFSKDSIKIAKNCLEHGKEAFEDLLIYAMKIFNKGRSSLKRISKQKKEELQDIAKKAEIEGVDTILEEIDQTDISLYHNLLLSYQNLKDWRKMKQISEFLLESYSGKTLTDDDLSKAYYAIATASLKLGLNFKCQEYFAKVNRILLPYHKEVRDIIEDQKDIDRKVSTLLNQEYTTFYDKHNFLLQQLLSKTSGTQPIASQADPTDEPTEASASQDDESSI